MGNTVWVLKEGQEEDDWDHTIILTEEKELDRLAQSLDVKKLSDYYDFSVLNEEYGGPDVEPNYVSADDVMDTLAALSTAVRNGSGDGNSEQKDTEGLLEELEDCFRKVETAKTENRRVRFSIVP